MSHRPWHRQARTIDLLLPFTAWLKGYSAEIFKKDAIAGLTVAAVLTPQAMAYAMLAGLPPIAGFYAALFGAIAASLWGFSKQLSTGPVAIVSFLVFSALVPLAEPGSSEYVMLAAALAILSGAVLLFLGVFRLGFILRIIPHTVVVGFATAAELIIIATQLPMLLGFDATQYEFVLPTLVSIAAESLAMHGWTVGIGIASIAFLVVLARISKWIPVELTVLVFMTAASAALDFSGHGIQTVGTIPAILPSLSIPMLSPTDWLLLLNKAWVIALVGFIGTYAIARSLAENSKERVNVDQELVGQGMANIAAGLSRGFPVSGSFSRSAVNMSSGAQTGIASVCAGIVVFFALAFVSPLFAFIPLTTLAAIVIVAVARTIDLKKLREIYALSHTDGIIALVTFAVAFILKPDDAIAIGIIVALVLFMRRIVSAKVRILGVESEWGILQGVGTSDNIETFRGVLIMRIETVAFYGNIDSIIGTIDQLIVEKEQREGKVDAIVFDCSSINYIDLSSAETLRHYFESLHEQGIKICSIYMRVSVYERLRHVGAEPFFTQLHNIKEMRAALSLPEPSSEIENVVESADEAVAR